MAYSTQLALGGVLLVVVAASSCEREGPAGPFDAEGFPAYHPDDTPAGIGGGVTGPAGPTSSSSVGIGGGFTGPAGPTSSSSVGIGGGFTGPAGPTSSSVGIGGGFTGPAGPTTSSGSGIGGALPVCECQDLGPCVVGDCPYPNDPCVYTNLDSTTLCFDDGNPCTINHCNGNGVCVADIITCPPASPCQESGCDPVMGCNPPSPIGSDCSDGDLCTQDDVCDGNGSCIGGSVVTCDSPNDCQLPGSCNQFNGNCVYPPKPQSAPCDLDDNACTLDTCNGSGSCVQGPVMPCGNAPDQCHDPPACNPSMGTCDPALPKAQGTPCNADDSACTQNDSCNGIGQCTPGAPVICAPPAECYAPGVCNMGSGQCTYQVQADGTACDDGSTCSSASACQAGICTATVTTCPPQGPCDNPTCDAMGQNCSHVPKLPNTPCNEDSNLCTQDTCDGTSFLCNAGPSVMCPAPAVCHALGVCNPATGICSDPPAPNGEGCDDGDLCTVMDTCQSGACVSGNPMMCPPLPDECASNACVAGACVQGIAPAGASCNDGNSCTTNDKCNGMSTVCQPGDVALLDGTPCEGASGPGICIAGICFPDQPQGASTGGGMGVTSGSGGAGGAGNASAGGAGGAPQIAGDNPFRIHGGGCGTAGGTGSRSSAGLAGAAVLALLLARRRPRRSRSTPPAS